MNNWSGTEIYSSSSNGALRDRKRLVRDDLSGYLKTAGRLAGEDWKSSNAVSITFLRHKSRSTQKDIKLDITIN